MKRLIALVILIGVMCSLCGWGTSEAQTLERDYQRVVVLSDAHYPSKIVAVKEPKKFMERVDNKWKAIDKVNSWKDVDLVVFTGDLVAETTSKKGLENAKELVSAVTKPVAVIAGNHDYYYKDALRNGKKQQASFQEKQANLQRFCHTFGLESPYYTKNIGGYLLVFLSPEASTENHLVTMSPVQLHWLDSTLAANRDKPTIIFFHAPLSGTLTNYEKKINTPNFVAEPEKVIEKIVLSFPQIVAWVSGHTHTKATNPSFASDINYFHGKVLDIHNPSMESKPICINSLYLYPDKVVIKTFSMKTGKMINKLTRTIDVREKMKAAAQEAAA